MRTLSVLKFGLLVACIAFAGCESRPVDAPQPSTALPVHEAPVPTEEQVDLLLLKVRELSLASAKMRSAINNLDNPFPRPGDCGTGFSTSVEKGRERFKGVRETIADAVHGLEGVLVEDRQIFEGTSAEATWTGLADLVRTRCAEILTALDAIPNDQGDGRELHGNFVAFQNLVLNADMGMRDFANQIQVLERRREAASER